MENQEKTTGSSSPSRALIYLRSAERNEGAITRQEEDCLRLITQRDYIHTASIVDNGFSGTGWKARPGLARALEMCESGAIDILVCARLDRLSRELGELLELLARLKAAGIKLETVAEGDVFAQPDILHRYEMVVLLLQSSGPPAQRKRGKGQQGPAYPNSQANLPLFDE